MKNTVIKLKKMIAQSKRVVVFTGAGISTDSGIPDFRGTNGIWSKYKPIPFDDFVNSKAARIESWQRKSSLHSDLKKAKPNLGHRGVFHLRERGVLYAVITQNVDGLHQASGIEEEKIIEIHGNALKAACLECNQNFTMERIINRFKVTNEPPICNRCGGFIKSATISFGQAMPELAIKKANDVAKNCDLFLVLGSSLVVYPAAYLPRVAKENSASLIIINHQKTSLDELADLVINDEIGAVLGQALNLH